MGKIIRKLIDNELFEVESQVGGTFFELRPELFRWFVPKQNDSVEETGLDYKQPLFMEVCVDRYFGLYKTQLGKFVRVIEWRINRTQEIDVVSLEEARALYAKFGNLSRWSKVFSEEPPFTA